MSGIQQSGGWAVGLVVLQPLGLALMLVLALVLVLEQELQPG